MPQRFEGRRLPAVLYAFPAEAMIAAAMIPAGILLIFPPYPINASTGDMTWVMISLLGGAFGIASGLITLIGLCNWRKHWQSGVEQLGLWLTFGTTFLYAAEIFILLPPQAAAPGCLGLIFIGISCILRARAIRIVTEQRLKKYQAANELRKESTKHGDVGP